MRKTGGGVLGPLVSRGGSRATRARGPRTVGGGSETRVFIQRYRPRPVPARADSVNSVSEDLLLVYRSWRGVSGFGSTSRAQRGDLCDRVLIVRTPCAHIRAERRNLDVTICTAIGVWALGATASLYTKPYSRRSRAPLQPQRCTTLHINTVCVRRGPKVCWSDGSGRCAILYSRGLASKPASPRQC